MMYLIVQTAVLLLAAYLIGALCGCWLRRRLAAGTGTSKQLPLTGSAMHDQPMIEVTPGPLPSIPELSAANRFERALIGPGSRAGDVQARPTDKPVSLTEEARTWLSASASASDPEAAELRTEEEGHNSEEIEHRLETTEQLLAAEPRIEPLQPSLAHEELVPEPTEEAPAATEEPLRMPRENSAFQSLPAATGSGGVIGTSAPLAPSSQQSADDLTRIRDIDADVAWKLAALGVSSYARLAAFTRADIDRVEAGLGQKRIARENWIEQAQVLSIGRTTTFARRIAGEEPLWPAADEIYAWQPAEFAPTVESAITDEFQSDVSLSVTSDAEAEDVEADIGQSDHEKADEDAAQTNKAQAQAEPAMSDAELTRICGIEAADEAILQAHGVRRFEEIAAWRAPDVIRFEGLIGSPGRIRRQNWIEQAQILASGGETAFTRRRHSNPPIVPHEPTAIELSDSASRELASFPQAPGDENNYEPVADAVKSYLAGLRSVKSPLLTGSEAKKSTASDDLKRIRGVGVLIERKLNSIGIYRYGQIANWTAAEVARISQMLDFKGRIERESWIEQARILASGGQTEFSSRVDRS